MRNLFGNPGTLFRNPFKKTGSSEKKSEDGRDQWQSRTSYLLASMGGAIGFGNLLRFPSQVYNNAGLQWFIPYFLAMAALAVPVLILEVSIGSSLRGGPVIAFNSLNRRARGAGLGNLWVTLLVVLYYVPMLSWVLRFFRASFESPLPWVGRLQEFYDDDVVMAASSIPATAPEAISQNTFMTYQGAAINGEQVGWTAFSWLVVWFCIYKGVSVTGKVVYVTMGLPIIMIFVLIVRGATLPNAIDGIRLYVGSFNGGQLVRGQIWQDALGQVFYSTGIGFGYYTAYASYNAKNANAVQDSIIICMANSLFEISCAFAVFCVVGFLGMTPGNTGAVGSFSLGFITLPAALAEIPGPQAWSVIFFFTLFMLAVSSAFVQIDLVITTLADTDRGQKIPRVYVSTGVILIAFLVSMIYATEFGGPLLDAIDANTNNIMLPFAVFSECYGSTVLYRMVDVVGQCGIPSVLVHQLGYLGGMALGLTLAHTVSIPGGIGAGFGLFFICFGASVLMAKTPDMCPPRFWSKNALLSRAWWLAFYSGNQLRRDLNITVADGQNWPLVWYWPICLRYISCPILAIVFSFAYPSYIAVRSDPLMIFAFIVAHIGVLSVLAAFIFPRWMDPLLPAARREEGRRTYAPMVVLGPDDIRVCEGIEAAFHQLPTAGIVNVLPGEHLSDRSSGVDDGMKVEGMTHDGHGELATGLAAK